MRYLNEDRKYPASLFVIERGLKYNKLQKRTDILIYNNSGTPELVVECKAASVNITQETFYQAIQYNWVLRAKYIIVTNGLRHFICAIDYDKNSYHYLQEIPAYESVAIR